MLKTLNVQKNCEKATFCLLILKDANTVRFSFKFEIVKALGEVTFDSRHGFKSSDI